MRALMLAGVTTGLAGCGVDQGESAEPTESVEQAVIPCDNGATQDQVTGCGANRHLAHTQYKCISNSWRVVGSYCGGLVGC
jgi:hypothetical protein